MCKEEPTRASAFAVQPPDQAEAGRNVLLEGSRDGAPAVMFLGNSVTWHGIKPDIGWYGKWGMAASAREKDYAHLLIRRIYSIYPKARFALTQGWQWEISLEQCDFDAEFRPARDFSADIIVFTLGANTPEEGLTQDRFRDSMEALLTYLSAEKTKWILCTNLFESEKNRLINGAILELAGKHRCCCIDMSDVLRTPENRAIGLFEHQGVANHPGDKGMACIADRIWPSLERCMADK